MNLGNLTSIAVKALMNNKLRGFLTMLGIIIGVLALVVLVSLVSSASASITDSVSSLGNSLLTVTVRDDNGNPLHLEDLQAYKSRIMRTLKAIKVQEQLWKERTSILLDMKEEAEYLINDLS